MYDFFLFCGVSCGIISLCNQNEDISFNDDDEKLGIMLFKQCFPVDSGLLERATPVHSEKLQWRYRL